MTYDAAAGLLTNPQQTLPSIPLPSVTTGLPDEARPLRWDEFDGAPIIAPRRAEPPVDPDATLSLQIELGRTRIRVDELASLHPGAILLLDNGVGDCVDLYADGQRVARGEVLAVNGRFGVRIVELFDGDV